MDYAYVLNLSLADFKRMKEAYQVLVRAGVAPNHAGDILVDAHLRLRREREQVTVERVR